MPPVEIMIVVLPAFIASRTSIQVISSSQTVSGGVIGLGVSMQLYGLAEHWPPPALRGSGACPRPRPCACVPPGGVGWLGGCAANAPVRTNETAKADATLFITPLLNAAWGR